MITYSYTYWRQVLRCIQYNMNIVAKIDNTRYVHIIITIYISLMNKYVDHK